MKVGENVYLDIFDTQTKKVSKYQSKVIGYDKSKLFIDFPIEINTRKTAVLQDGTDVTVSYLGDDQTPRAFQSEILGKARKNIPALVLEIPEEENIERIQRRKYVRIKIAIDIAIHCPHKSFSPLTTVSQDISGGGVSIITSNNGKLFDAKNVKLWFVLPSSDSSYVYISSDAKIIRTKQVEGNRYVVSFKFTSVDNRTKQKIIQFCFEKQRESRQKGYI